MPNTAFMHSFYTLFKEGNGLYLLKLYVEEAMSNNRLTVFSRAYQLKDIKKVAEIPNGVLSSDRGLTDEISSTNYNVADLFEFVNVFEENYNPNPVNKELLNDDGTPKFFYHSTNATFEAFDNSQKQGNYYNTNSIGNWFSDSENIANTYHRDGIMMKCYVTFKNPLVVNA